MTHTYYVRPPGFYRPGAVHGDLKWYREPMLRPYGNDWLEPPVVRISRFRHDLIKRRDLHWCFGIPLVSEGVAEEVGRLPGALLDRATDSKGAPLPILRLRGAMVEQPDADLFFFRTPERPYSLLVGELGLEFLRENPRFPCCAFEMGPHEPSVWDDPRTISKRDIARLCAQGLSEADARAEMERFIQFKRMPVESR